MASFVDCRLQLGAVFFDEIGFLFLFGITRVEKTRLSELKSQNDAVLVAIPAAELILRRPEYVDGGVLEWDQVPLLRPIQLDTVCSRVTNRSC